MVNVIYDLIVYDLKHIPDIYLSDSNGDESLLSKKVDDIMLVFYLPNLGCSSCYEQEVSLLKKMIPAEVRKKVMVIGNFSNLREQKIFERNCDLSTYRIRDTFDNDFPIALFSETSVAFLLNNQMQCFAFFNAVGNIDASKLYYRMVVDRISATQTVGE